MFTPLLESFPAHSNLYEAATTTVGAALFAAMGERYLIRLIELRELSS